MSAAVNDYWLTIAYFDDEARLGHTCAFLLRAKAAGLLAKLPIAGGT